MFVFYLDYLNCPTYFLKAFLVFKYKEGFLVVEGFWSGTVLEFPDEISHMPLAIKTR